MSMIPGLQLHTFYKCSVFSAPVKDFPIKNAQKFAKSKNVRNFANRISKLSDGVVAAQQILVLLA